MKDLLKSIQIELIYLRQKIEEMSKIIEDTTVEQHTHIHYEQNNYEESLEDEDKRL